MDRQLTFEEIGEYKVSAKVYKVMRKSLLGSIKELVRDYDFTVIVNESDDLYADMGLPEKLLEALKNVKWTEVAASTVEEVLKTLPVMVGMLIALSAVLIAITMSPVGWLMPLVGGAMQVYGGANAVKDILPSLYLFADAFLQTKDAKSRRAIEQASALFTQAFKYVGPSLLMDILMMLGGKAVKSVKGGNKIDDFEKGTFGKRKKSRLSKNKSGNLKIENKKFTTEPFGENGKLKPKIRYRAGEYKYFYETDELGRINLCNADELHLKKHDARLRHNPNTPGKLADDHAGHLIADLFGGSPELDNLVSQSKLVNQKAYRKIERDWQRALKKNPPQKVTDIKIEIMYDGKEVRPKAFKIEYRIDGKPYSPDLILNL